MWFKTVNEMNKASRYLEDIQFANCPVLAGCDMPFSAYRLNSWRCFINHFDKKLTHAVKANVEDLREELDG
jgi:hypothetical protein